MEAVWVVAVSCNAEAVISQPSSSSFVMGKGEEEEEEEEEGEEEQRERESSSPLLPGLHVN